MWTLYRTAKATASRPSELLCVADRLAAYLFDSAVTTFGTIIENAAQETEKRGPEDKPRYEAKYTMKQLLDQSFRLPVDSDGSTSSPTGGAPGELSEADGLIIDEV